MSGCYLEGYWIDGETVYRIPINAFPALVGRETGLAVTLHSNNVSRQHAELLQQAGQLLIRDLGSTNGTFVNHEPVTDCRPLSSGDVVRFADIEFRLRQENGEAHQQPAPDTTVTAYFPPDEHVDRIPIGAQHLEELLEDKLVLPLFQPIVSTVDERIVGLELLGRGNHPELSELPVPLFFLADSLGRAVELSEILRDVGVQRWATSSFRDIPLFVNTQPKELKDSQQLIASLRALRNNYRDVPLVLEIHEQAVTDHETLNTLNHALQGMNIDLAYDDFGAGQARLLELMNIPPYAVKFDISLIRGLDEAPRQRQDMIGLLVKLVKKGHTLALAEGVSNSGELAVCRQRGFDMIQGFVYGEPVPLEQLNALPTLGQQ
jgi:EAL domain-containing protein (putative c-di-GMP-specific phosphodiesterase class I)